MSSLNHEHKKSPGVRSPGVDARKTFWRSMDELGNTPEFQRFVKKEFPSLAGEILSSRRSFLKIMSASLGLAGMTTMTGCLRWPKENIVPFTNRPAGRLPGVPVSYATMLDLGGAAQPLLVTSYDGRPIKIEGNPDHPMSLGAANMHTQASILDLYDPRRCRGIAKGGEDQEKPRPWDEAVADLNLAGLAANGGQGLAIVTEPTSSPSFAAEKTRIQKALPNAKWCEYAGVSRDNERQGAVLAFGAPYRTHLNIDKAKVIVSLDADFLMTHPAALRHTREFARGRRGDDGKMNQLHVVEGTLSVTGAMADHRYAARPSLIPGIGAALVMALKAEGLFQGAAGLQLNAGSGEAATRMIAVAHELAQHRGESLIVVGPRQEAELHALAHWMNRELGNVGKTVSYSAEEDSARLPHVEALAALVDGITNQKIEKVLILGGNPVFDAPADIDLAAALGGVTSYHLTSSPNETSAVCTWILPEAHALETWGDGRGHDGTYTLQQPLIAPLYGGKSAIEVLAHLGSAPGLGEFVIRSGHDIVRATFRARGVTGDFDDAWQTALHDGFVKNSAHTVAASPAVRFGQAQWNAAVRPSDALSDGQIEVIFAEDHKVQDGRFFQNAWLQELPDPITKLCWDNAALVSPTTALSIYGKKKVGANRQGDRHALQIQLDVGGKTLTIPMFVLPGHADGCVTIPLGYREPADEGFPIRTYNEFSAGGGFNAYPFRTAGACAGAVVIASVSQARGEYKLATTQDHHAIERASVLEPTVGSRIADLVKTRNLHDDSSGEHGGGSGDDEHGGENSGFAPADKTSLWADMKMGGHRWAMAIDLSTCTGCSACIVACQAENNIGVVGKDELAYGREMHWLRIDRYFKGNPKKPDDIEVAHQPMPCQHCENAPCEQVCPVGATMHSEDGLNDMTYNRCIGTRYCSNNCPYKVRRFNYFNNFKHFDAVEQMQMNPEVTIRHRGVMEKCTYCIQRISGAKITARNEGRGIADGEVTPACAQTCPAEAIVFGDLKDPDSRVAQMKKSERNYTILDELNVKPRTSYLERLKNPMGGHG